MTKFVISVVLLFVSVSSLAGADSVKLWQAEQASKLTCNLALLSTRDDLLDKCSIGR